VHPASSPDAQRGMSVTEALLAVGIPHFAPESGARFGMTTRLSWTRRMPLRMTVREL